jgi:hypothetical protein
MKAHRRAKKMLLMSKQLRRCARIVTWSRIALQEMGVVIHNQRLDNAPEALKSHADLVEKLGSSLYAGTKSERPGRVRHLVYLSYLLEIVTGRQHYEELAELVWGIKRLEGTLKKTTDSGNLKNVIKRFEHNHSGSAAELKVFAGWESPECLVANVRAIQSPRQ